MQEKPLRETGGCQVVRLVYIKKKVQKGIRYEVCFIFIASFSHTVVPVLSITLPTVKIISVETVHVFEPLFPLRESPCPPMTESLDLAALLWFFRWALM